MKEPKRRQSLSGAVLIMVLTVMFVLIILLTATLTTVTTANQRIYTKFEENQAYYTARSALDVFTQNMLNDEKYDTSKDYHYWDAKTSTAKTVKMKQGLGLQLDLYELKSADGVGLEQNVLNTAASGKDEREQYTVHYGVLDSSPQDKYVYEVEFPKLSNSSDDYGRLVDTGSTATITVEVLERRYDLGSYVPSSGTNSGVDIQTKADDLTFLTTAGNAADIAEAMELGNRKNDKMKVKITSQVVYGGVEGLAIVIIDTSKPPVTNSSKAVTTFGTSGGHNVNLIGGAASQDDVSATNDPHVYGDVYFEKGYTVSTTLPVYTLYEGGSFFVGGDFETHSGSLEIKSADPANFTGDKAPFVYVNGKLKPENFKINQGVDVIVAGGVDDLKNGLIVNGNLYVKGTFDARNEVALTGNGNIYIDGDVIVRSSTDGKSFTVKPAQTNGDGSVTPPVLTVRGGFTGNVYVKGKIHEAGSTDDLTTYATSGDVSALTTSITLPDYDDIKKADSDEKYIEFTLPGSVTKKLPNNVDSFGNYYKVNATTGKVTVDAGTGKGELVSAEELAFVAPEDRKLGVTTTETFEHYYSTSSPALVQYSHKNEDGYKWRDPSGTAFTVEAISLTDTESVCKLGSGAYEIRNPGMSTPSFYCENDTDLFFAPGSYSNLKIYAAEGANVRIFGTQTAGTYNFDNCYFMHRDIYNKTKASPVQPIYVGAQGSDMIVPNFQFFFGNGSELNFTNDSIVTGYIQSPGTVVNIYQSNSTTLMSYNDSTPFSERVKIIGSVLCKDLNPSVSQHTGIAYVNPDADVSKPGLPHLVVKPYQYVRG
ncbi:MAG: hypothetical protein NC253_06580 [Ruminococcus sp.]|nr:hypothetical protein [Ruminococcus sp.]MCM1380419.1 hypothetical protein [Muribaculaceae bacterium]MCM1478913.1 hypothetical protein [Muribaculaceae bacterium]